MPPVYILVNHKTERQQSSKHGGRVTFNEATDQLMAKGVTLADVASALGVVHGTIRQARLDASSPSYRRPPEGWEGRLAELAERRGSELAELAQRIRGGKGEA